MPQASSKNGKKRMSKAQRRRMQRQKRLVALGLVVLGALLIAAIVWMLAVGLGRRADSVQQPPVASAAPTQEPVATSEPAATAEPTAVPTPTAEPTPTVAPEPVYITLTAVGDCTLGGTTNSGAAGEKRFADCFEEYGADYTDIIDAIKAVGEGF